MLQETVHWLRASLIRRDEGAPVATFFKITTPAMCSRSLYTYRCIARITLGTREARDPTAPKVSGRNDCAAKLCVAALRALMFRLSAVGGQVVILDRCRCGVCHHLTALTGLVSAILDRLRPELRRTSRPCRSNTAGVFSGSRNVLWPSVLSAGRLIGRSRRAEFRRDLRAGICFAQYSVELGG